MVENEKSPLPPTALQKGRSVGYRQNLAKNVRNIFTLRDPTLLATPLLSSGRLICYNEGRWVKKTE